MQFNISFYEQDQLVMTVKLLASNEIVARSQISKIAKAINCDSWAIDTKIFGAVSIS